jgi:hypothetical protein
MLDFLLYVFFTVTLFVAARWLVALLAQAIVALLTLVASLTGTIIVVSALFYLILQLAS